MHWCLLVFFGVFGDNETIKSGIISLMLKVLFSLVLIIYMLQEWNAVRNVATTPSNQQPGATCIWWKSSAGQVKCNVDASFSSQNNKVGTYICIRDDQGVFILAKTEWFSPKGEVHIGEALELLAALNWVHKLNLGPMEFELDPKRVVDSFRSSKCDFTKFG
jgi:hypothetical protein